jgi:hypothetical protein
MPKHKRLATHTPIMITPVRITLQHTAPPTCVASSENTKAACWLLSGSLKAATSRALQPSEAGEEAGRLGKVVGGAKGSLQVTEMVLRAAGRARGRGRREEARDKSCSCALLQPLAPFDQLCCTDTAACR